MRITSIWKEKYLKLRKKLSSFDFDKVYSLTDKTIKKKSNTIKPSVGWSNWINNFKNGSNE